MTDWHRGERTLLRNVSYVRVSAPPSPTERFYRDIDQYPRRNTVSKATFELYRDRGGEWRWRLRHDTGNIVADSGEGYATKQKAKRGIESVKSNASDAPIEVAD